MRTQRNIYLLLSVGLVTAYLWLSALSPARVDGAMQVYARIIEGHAGVPYQQRVLLPLLLDWRNEGMFIWQVALLHFVAFPLWFVGLWRWLRRFGRYGLAVTIFSALYIVLGLQSWGAVNAWTAVEIVCAVWLLVLIDHDVTAFALIAIATVNRPFSGALLALTYAVYHRDSRGIAALLAWTGIYTGLLIIFPANGWTMGEPIGRHIERNTDTFLWQGICNSLCLLPLLGLAAVGWRSATTRLKLLTLVVPPYLIVLAFMATWYESPRLILTAYPLLGALMVVGLEDQ
jgi:hypothetical protein